MPIDDQTYGFNKPDALELVQLIGNSDREHNDWHPVPNDGSPNSWIEFVVASQETKTSGPYFGLVVATVAIKGAPAGSLIDTSVDVVDHSGCIFDQDVTGFTGWAQWGIYRSLDPEVECDVLTPYHYAAFQRCCSAGSGNYADPCP